MKDLLLPRSRRVLEALLAPGGAPPLLAFDYDGVLAPIIANHHGAPMPARTRRLLVSLAARLPVAIVSGRSYAKLLRVARGISPWLVGSHGYDYLGPVRPAPAEREQVDAWEQRLAEAVARWPGAALEHKRTNLCLHWARVPPRRRPAAARALAATARRLPGVRLVPGKNVLNVLPAGFPTKGDAIRRLVAQLGCRRALFVGDDVTDEDVFALPRRLVLGVHVGRGPSRAAYRLEDHEEVNALLERLVELAQAWRPRPAALPLRVRRAPAARPASRPPARPVKPARLRGSGARG
jgi:trehalose 6-phosphate phosphatase